MNDCLSHHNPVGRLSPPPQGEFAPDQMTSMGRRMRLGVDTQVDHYGRSGKGGPACPPLSTYIQWFKTMTTNETICGVKQLGWRPFDGKLWQRNYYEHIIRNEADLMRIQEYIASNTANWQDDEENPEKRYHRTE